MSNLVMKQNYIGKDMKQNNHDDNESLLIINLKLLLII